MDSNFIVSCCKFIQESDDEEIIVFEEEVDREEEESHHEDEGPSEAIQHVLISESRNKPKWLKSTLLDAKGHGAAKGSFRERKKPKRYNGYVTYMTKMRE